MAGPANASRALGAADTYTATGPFSIVYTLAASATRSVQVTYYGTTTLITSVPEIGTDGAFAAIALVFGSIAVMNGRRRRTTDPDAAAA